MKKKNYLLLFLVAILGFVVYNLATTEESNNDNAEVLRQQHENFLANSPYKDTKRLSKKERKAEGLPPNAYYEQAWELTMDPSTGRPMPERLFEIQEGLTQKKLQNASRDVGGSNSSPWVDRGPNNIGGRTRGIMFDPNDTDNNRVFSGGVSGGLWVNEDITDANSSWTLVPGIGANISVTKIIYDPNDTNTFYIGSGESYTSGRAIGRGIWKSTDGGVTWANIFGGADGTISNSGQLVNGIFYINDIVARNNNGSTELYIAVAGAFNGSSSNTNQFNGLNEQGFYKSTDDGTTWSRLNSFIFLENNNSFSNPCDIELDINNNIWLTTTRSDFGFNGGKVFNSTDGINFSLVTTIPNARRTELEPSNLDPNKFWVAVNSSSGQADLYITDNAFSTITAISEPNDADNGIPANDYCRGQAFYDLPIEVDANDHLYVGGIDLFRSTDDGNTWTQISKWSNNNNLAQLNVPFVHADHHAIVFRPGAGNGNQAVFGTDGGIYYSPDITASQTSIVINSRNRDYNVTQFYYGSIASSIGTDILYGGTQDNGTLISQNSIAGANSYNNYYAFTSGDGSYSEIDEDGGGIPGRGRYMIVGSVFLNYYMGDTSYTSSGQAFSNGYDIVSTGEGNFINEADLDDAGNILYANSSVGNTFRFSKFVLGTNSATRSNLSNALLNGEPSAFKVSPHNNNTIFVGTRNSRILKVDNLNLGTQTWTNLSGASFVGSISDIEVGSSDMEIFVTVHNYGVTSIWYTSDGGTTWENKEGNLPDLPVKCILQNPLIPSEVIVGTELGVWATNNFDDPNPSWIQSFNGMSDVTVLDLDLRVADNTILATTHGRGQFTSQFTSQPLSIEDFSQNNFDIRVTNNNSIKIRGVQGGNNSLKLFDITGKEILSRDFIGTNTNEISLPSLTSGVYIALVNTEQNGTQSKKVILK